MAAALFLLCSYYLLSIRVFLSAQVSGEFKLTYAYVGPTELRLLAIAFNCGVYFVGPIGLTVGGSEVSVYTLLVLLRSGGVHRRVLSRSLHDGAKTEAAGGRRVAFGCANQRPRSRMKSSIAAKNEGH